MAASSSSASPGDGEGRLELGTDWRLSPSFLFSPSERRERKTRQQKKLEKKGPLFEHLQGLSLMNSWRSMTLVLETGLHVDVFVNPNYREDIIQRVEFQWMPAEVPEDAPLAEISVRPVTIIVTLLREHGHDLVTVTYKAPEDEDEGQQREVGLILARVLIDLLQSDTQPNASVTYSARDKGLMLLFEGYEVSLGKADRENTKYTRLEPRVRSGNFALQRSIIRDIKKSLRSGALKPKKKKKTTKKKKPVAVAPFSIFSDTTSDDLLNPEIEGKGAGSSTVPSSLSLF